MPTSPHRLVWVGVRAHRVCARCQGVVPGPAIAPAFPCLAGTAAPRMMGAPTRRPAWRGCLRAPAPLACAPWGCTPYRVVWLHCQGTTAYWGAVLAGPALPAWVTPCGKYIVRPPGCNGGAFRVPFGCGATRAFVAVGSAGRLPGGMPGDPPKMGVFGPCIPAATSIQNPLISPWD